MPDIYLNVPYVSQLNIGSKAGPNGGRNDPTGCWYAAISMIGYYYEAGPRLGVPEQYVKPSGAPQKADKWGNTAAFGMGKNYDKLLENENLVTVPLPKDKIWTCMKLVQILNQHGPCYVRRGFINQGKLVGGHAVVLVGAKTSSNEVILHDPWTGPDKHMSIADFNKVFKWEGERATKYSIMHKARRTGAAKTVEQLVAEIEG